MHSCYPRVFTYEVDSTPWAIIHLYGESVVFAYRIAHTIRLNQLFDDVTLQQCLRRKIYNCPNDLKNQHTSPKVFILFSFFFILFFSYIV